MFAALSSVILGGCRKHRITIGFFVCASFACYLFVSVVDKYWTGSFGRFKKPEHVAGAALSDQESGLLYQKNWDKEYSDRLELIRQVCENDEVAMTRRIWRVAANRRWGKDTYCKTKTCPIIVDEKKVLFFCFIPKVASTKVKEFFLNITGIHVDESTRRNSTALHILANDKLKRVSPMYYPATTARRFFKMIFVRHPFDRLVSAFRSKAEPPRSELGYFYKNFWDRVLHKLRPNSTIDENTRLTFPEFVWYLTHSLQRDFDDHWAPYWSRCDPCLVDYDFVGKLETSDHDFPYAFKKVGIESTPDWWSSHNSVNRAMTLKYFADVPEKAIRDLYKLYKLDFELFGYTLDGFINNKPLPQS